MSVVEALTIPVIALESCNIFFMVLLLATPAPKHPVVKGLSSHVFFVLYSLGVNVTGSPKAVSICIVDSILLGYITVVKAAFAVNFTLPFFWLALLQIRPKSSADDHPQLTRRMVVILCVSPFLWALPVLFTPIARIVHGTPANVQFNISSCYFDDPAFAIISLIFTLIPLGVSVVITMALVSVIWRFSDAMLEHTGWLFVKTKRFARFAALVFVSMVSASLYTVVLSQWIHLRHAWPNESSRWNSDDEWTGLIHASVLWEAITPMLFFLIFAAQEEVCETWLGWLSRIANLCRRLRVWKRDGCSVPASQCGTSTGYESHRVPPMRSMIACDAEATFAALSPLPRPVASERIIARRLSSPFVRLSWYTERGCTRSRSVSSLDGLTPAPRRVAAKADTMVETPQSVRSPARLFGGPFLLTFGSQNTTGSRGLENSAEGSDEVAEGGELSVTDLEALSRQCTRADTPASSTTFARLATGKRPTT